MAHVGDRIKVHIRNTVLAGTASIGNTPMSVSGEIVEDLGHSWLVQLEISVDGKNQMVVPKGAEVS